jgi:hypothetical protein
MDRFDDDTLFNELRELRPKPRPEFTAELDERAAAGFPRRQAPSAAAMPFAKLADWWRAKSPSGRLVPVLAAALAVLVVATGVVAIAQSGGGGSSAADEAALSMVPGPGESGVAAEAESEGGGAAEESFESAAGATGRSGAGGGHHKGNADAGEAVYGAEVPTVEAEPPAALAAPAEEEESAGSEEAAEEEGGAASFEAESGPVAPLAAGGANHAAKKAKASPATGGRERDIERSAYVVLGTKPGQVAGAAAKVYTAVHAANGIVLHSSVQSGKAGATGASFELLIPSAKLDDALAAFSSIAEVRERHDATNDITAPTVSAAEELADSSATIDSLLKQLGDAETESEMESLEARLREERRRHAAIRAGLDHLNERASMSEVSVRIVTGNGAGAVPPGKGSDDGGWGVGDALHDAGHILTTAAAVALIALAILGPIALIAILLWGGNRFRIRRLRERTLG